MKIKTLITIILGSIILVSCTSQEKPTSTALTIFIFGVLLFLAFCNGGFFSDADWGEFTVSLLVFVIPTIGLLAAYSTALLFLYCLIVAFNFLFLFLYVAFSNQPESVKNGFLLDDDGYKWQAYVINYFRVQIENLPLWFIPAKQWNRESERDLLKRATLLYYEAKNTIKRHSFPNEIQRPLLYQCFLIPQNLANGLWKLANLRRLFAVTNGVKTTKTHESENTQLQQELIREMEFLVEKLSSLSLSLLKSEITRDNKTIESILYEMSDSNNRLQQIISPDNFVNKSQKKSSVYYVVVFLILATTFTIISIYAPTYALPTIIIGSLLGFITIGLFQLRNDEYIKDESFTKVIVEILKAIRLIK